MGSKRKIIAIVAVAGVAAGVCLSLAIGYTYNATSTSESCMQCHVHPDSDMSWKQSKHCINSSGVSTGCAECHLPPKDHYFKHLASKTAVGVKDLAAYAFGKKVDWDARSGLDYAKTIVYNESCLKCHTNLFPEGLSDDGVTAHLYYDENAEKSELHCISCHLDAGHYDPNYSHKSLKDIASNLFIENSSEKYDRPALVTSFEDFTETVPGTSASLEMVAVPGGTFTMGSPADEAFRGDDEGPQRQVTVSDFFMGKVEVTWDQYWAFYGETMSEGRTPPEQIYANNSREDIDAVSGPTPPFGNPDQGWGMGERPALTMTHYAAETFCQWLSLKTGKHYRLPTEAEWEYAARGGTTTAYFFEGNPRKLSSRGLLRKISKPDTAGIYSNVVYQLNSHHRTQEPSAVGANPFGLKNMLGNVMEYCQDWYAEDAYSRMQDGAVNPKGPDSGSEHVVRGGLFSDDASLVRCAARGCTHHDEWLTTDPQKPKSIWWYSDVQGIGFRVVCDKPETINQ